MEGDDMEGDDMEGEGFKDFMKKVKRAKIGKKIVKYAKDILFLDTKIQVSTDIT